VEQPSQSEAREILQSDGEAVIEPWEERVEVVESGLDDTTAPLPGPSTDSDHASDREGPAEGAS
jgi:hypothetical protein